MRIAAFKPTVNALKLSTHHESKHSGSRNQPEVDAVKLGLSWVATSVIRLADFYKFLTTNCLTKVAQIFWWLLAEITSLLCKKVYLLFGQFWGEIRQLFPSFYHLVTLVVTQTFSPIVRSFVWSTTHYSSFIWHYQRNRCLGNWGCTVSPNSDCLENKNNYSRVPDQCDQMARLFVHIKPFTAMKNCSMA